MALREGEMCYLLNGSPGDCNGGLLCEAKKDPQRPGQRDQYGVCRKGNLSIYCQADNWQQRFHHSSKYLDQKSMITRLII